MHGVPIEALERLPLFADLTRRELQSVARLFKERRFAKGETVVKEGSGGAAFFVIESGEATVFIGGKERSTLKAGRLFRRGRADRPGRAPGDDRGGDRSRLLRPDLLGLPPVRRAERRDRLEAARADGDDAARRAQGLSAGRHRQSDRR